MRTTLCIVSILIAVSLFLGGCATDPYTGEKKMSKTAWGSIIGTVGGAAVGAAVTGHEDRRKG
ncbi:MAG: hypothetical protein RRA35_10275, partial [Desulfomonilia bacterium]|nr:hypothetical protein [Desulfomonilia bacterium]